MADRIECKLSFTPIVTLDDDTDGDGVDVHQHDIKVTGGVMNVVARDAADKWYYAPNVIVTTTTSMQMIGNSGDVTELDGASGNQSDPNAAAGATTVFTDGTTIDCDADKVIWFFIKNTGTSDVAGTPTDRSVYWRIHSGAHHNSPYSPEIKAGEVFMTRGSVGSASLDVDALMIIAGDADSASAGSGDVRCTVVAMIEDESA